jgi:hypothetical protein
MAGITRTTRMGLFILGFLAATGVEVVRADEAYLCDDGRIVKVPFGKLEEMKRTDACVAAYHGLTVGGAQPLETGAIPPAPRASAEPSAVPAAVDSAALMIPSAPAGQRPAAAARTRTPPLVSANLAPVIPRAAAGTDYRNVVLLNAAPGAPGVYRHER